ncbi:MAG: hypothetical protein VW420_02800, partial [Schleiferiaceae bacterium]
MLRTVARELGLRPEARKLALRAVVFALKRLISFTIFSCGGTSPRAEFVCWFVRLLGNAMRYPLNPYPLLPLNLLVDLRRAPGLSL